MSKPEWTDRRRWNNGLLLFTAGLIVYAVLYYPLAPRETLLATTIEALITASVVTITGYTMGRLAEKHRALKGGQDDDSQV
jgi:multisubunit Na+/H+ antiporter MnhB subunit